MYNDCRRSLTGSTSQNNPSSGNAMNRLIAFATLVIGICTVGCNSPEPSLADIKVNDLVVTDTKESYEVLDFQTDSMVTLRPNTSLWVVMTHQEMRAADLTMVGDLMVTTKNDGSRSLLISHGQYQRWYEYMKDLRKQSELQELIIDRQ